MRSLSSSARYLLILWVVALAPAVYLLRGWLFSLKPFTVADWPNFAAQTLADLWPPNPGWASNFDLGWGGADVLPFFFWLSLLGWAGTHHISYAIGERVLFMLPFAVLIFAGPYALTRELFDSRVAGIVAGFLSFFNAYTQIEIHAGQIPIVLAEALLPLFVLFFIRMMRGPSFVSVLALGTIFSLIVGSDLRIAYIAALIGAALAVGFVLRRRRVSWPALGAVALSCALVPAAVHAAWLLPTLAQGHGPALPAAYDAVAWFNVLSFMTLANALTLFSPWFYWTGYSLPNFVGGVPLVFALFPVLALVPAVLRPRQPWIIAFTLLFLAGAFLVKGAQPPFGDVNTWLYTHFPGMFAFREPAKYFAIGLTFGAPLAGLGVAFLAQRVGPRLGPAIPVAFMLVWLAAAMWPPLSGGAFGILDEPAESSSVNSLLDRDKSFSRVLWLPRRDPFGEATRVHPAVDGAPQNPGFISAYTYEPPATTTWPLTWLERPYARWLVDTIGAGYLVVPDESRYPIFPLVNTPRPRIMAALRALPWLEHNRRIGGIDVFRVRAVAPRITGSSAAITVRSDAALRALESAALPDSARRAPVMITAADEPPLPETADVVGSPKVSVHGVTPAAPPRGIVADVSTRSLQPVAPAQRAALANANFLAESPSRPCSAFHATWSVPLAHALPLWAHPSLSWIFLTLRPHPALLVLLEDSRAKRLCLPIPMDGDAPDFPLALALGKALDVEFAQEAAARRYDFGWNPLYRGPRSTNGFTVVGLFLPSQIPPAMRVSVVLDMAGWPSGQYASEYTPLPTPADVSRIREVPIESRQLSADAFSVSVQSAPAWITLRDAYNQGWVASLNSHTLLHRRANGAVNAWYVPTPGTVTIDFAPARIGRVGEVISIGSALLICLLWAIVGVRSLRR